MSDTRATRTTNELAEERTDLALQRTVMAADRSLMAWIRTGLSMISFGFTLYKVLQAFQASGALLPRESTPRNLGLFLTGLGTASLLVGVIDHVQTLRRLRSGGGQGIARPSLFLAILVAGLGIFLFVAILVRVL
jgi:putative membrane protein